MRTLLVKHIKPVCFVLCCLPLAYLATLFLMDELGANPIEWVTRFSGTWALRMLLIALMATPLQRGLGAVWPFRIRRMLGLFGFFYVTVHLSSYIVLDQFFDWYEIYYDLVERPFIMAGMVAFVLLIPLAITSTKKMMRRLGKRWKQLHRSVYLIAALGILHYFLLIKLGWFEPAIYLLVYTLLMIMRMPLTKMLSQVVRREPTPDSS
ncbi:MAG: sulfoxide reductase heme-binding subunit YedZ [Pseudomonadales bacterium]|nr:sulfoxide reductase heme-binding subunit YedZ [Pseudomonadales bacterium]